MKKILQREVKIYKNGKKGGQVQVRTIGLKKYLGKKVIVQIYTK